ncbi:NAD-dependent epimerase/dehydratase family protein [Actinoplanes utahensis]|uniref:NAD-dependent epimerase/dehydratase family protein n=1 Tax=Actinoplanes utahensis TaxID=1869 RepID=UPI00068D3F40|nr:NAD-dependent epimerase/dehydratase family protein [Actinoplanes utahensis]GIF28834.1 CDP-glucose 4,6-dehydratase [Actinoplanes utahensis]
MPSDLFAGGYTGRRVLVTGHTGAVGGWMTRWLVALGAEVVGLSRGRHAPVMPPPADVHSVAGTVTDAELMRHLFREHRVETVFHLAGQAVVADGFTEPRRTFTDNVLGTVAVLDAALTEPATRAVVVIGTPAGGIPAGDTPLAPYAGSKAAAEAVVAGYAHEQTQRAAGRATPLAVAVARPGVMVGGDWTPGRLLTDVVAAIRAGSPVVLRGGDAVRPWQHMLDGVSGLLTLGARLMCGPAPRRSYAFGRPPDEDDRTSAEVVRAFLRAYGHPDWALRAGGGTGLDRLTLDCAVATRELGWKPVWNLDRTVAAASRWYHAHGRPAALSEATDAILDEYIDEGRRAGAVWTA